MNAAIITTTNDPASMNIRKHLLNDGFEKISTGIGTLESFRHNSLGTTLHTYEKDSIYLEGIDRQIGCDILIFATMHQSKSKIPVLSAHTAGNWGNASLGGMNRTLCLAPANYIKEALIKLNSENTLRWDVVQEATHHGPCLSKPSFFIEIGSTNDQWNNNEAGKILAKVITDIIKTPPKDYPSAMAIGGLHTMPNFKKIILGSEIAIGHACAKYDLENLDEKMIRQAIEKTTPTPSMLILDWKSLGPHKTKIKELAERSGLEVMRTKDF